MIVNATYGQLDTCGSSQAQRWEGPDDGLLAAWFAGICLAEREPAMAEAALTGQLLELPFKGGVVRKLKVRKFGTYWYLAMWRGLRRESLHIDTSSETRLVCSRFGVEVTFTTDRRHWNTEDI